MPVVALFLLLAGILPPVPSGAAAEALPFELSPEEAGWLRSHPVIRYGADPSWLPFSVRSGDRIEGVDQDMIQLFGKRLGIRFEYVPTESWGDTLAKLRKGEIDFVSGIAAFLRRPEDFSRLAGRLREEGNLRDHPVEFVRADGSGCPCRCSIRLLEDEAGSAVGIEWRAFGSSGAGGNS